MSAFFKKFRQDVAGVLWIAGSLFTALALASFNPTDPSFNSVGMNLKVQNQCGYIGSFLADLLYQAWGVSAWLVVLGGVRLGLGAFRPRSTSSSFAASLFWAVLPMTVLSSLLTLHWPAQRLWGHPIPIGGVLGTIVSKGLMSAFNYVGVAILLWSVAILLLIFYTERSLPELLKHPIQFTRHLIEVFTAKLVSIGRLFEGAFLKPQMAGRVTADAVTAVTPAERKESFFSALPKKKKSSDLKVAAEHQEDLVEPEAQPEEAGSNPPLKVTTTEVQRRKVRITAKIERRIENWKLPDVNLLEDPPASRVRVDEREMNQKARTLVDKLAQFAVKGEVVHAKPGPAVTMFEFKPNADVKISKITELADDLSLALRAESLRIIAPIPGRDVVGIETSNEQREIVYLKDSLANDAFWSESMRLPICLGRQADGESKVVDLRKMPHLMVAGTTGSGKSVFVVSAITGLLFKHSPKTLRLILIDPKQVDLAAFNNIPHLLMPPIREPKKAVSALKWAIREMDKRYRSMSRFGARGLESFNEIVARMGKEDLEKHEQTNLEWESDSRKLEQYYFTPQPYIVIVVEEFGDLMAVDKQNVENLVVRLAQMARACGIHLVLAMQSPRKDVVTGLIKTNIPGRISFKVASKMDSRIILDESGGERLLPNGDMLFLAPGVSKPQRNHAPWVTEAEISAVMRFWSEQGEPQYDPLAMKALDGSGGGFDLAGDGESDGFGEEGGEGELDERYDEVLAAVSSMKEVSASLLQRRFKLGYPRAARMIEIFEREGVVGPANGSKPRQVLISSYEEK